MSALTMRDKFGNTLRVGDFCIYGRNLGRCATPALGRVIEIKPQEEQKFRNGYVQVKIVMDTLQHDETVYVIRQPYIKRVTIQESQRVIRYCPSAVSDEIKAMFLAAAQERAQ